MGSERPYDLVLLGATGYTGALTAEHIAEHLPTNLKWAIAGRSRNKLEKLAEDLKKINPDRLQPEVETVQLKHAELNGVLGKSRVCISAVGPYPWNGEVVIEACIAQVTHYIDTSGDIPWLKKMIEKHGESAKSSGVLLVHSAGYFTATQDLLARAVILELNKNTSQKTKEVVLAVCETFAQPSGGSLLSVLDAFESLDAKTLAEFAQPWYLSPISGKETSEPTNFLGMRHDPDLGSLAASSIGAGQNRAVVHRTWGLLNGGDLYGRNFQYNEYNKHGTLAGVGEKLSNALLWKLLGMSLFRSIAKRFVPAPGEGPDLATQKNGRIEMQAVAVADEETAKPRRAFGKLTFSGGSYAITGAWLAQGAATIAYNPDLVRSIGGGFVTPAVLGQTFIDRAESGGVYIETRMLWD